MLPIEIEEHEYLRYGEKPLLARVFKPRRPSAAPSGPAVVQLHGGAWCDHDRQKDSILNIALAQAGVTVAAIDFRVPPDARYPETVADINYAVRWLKSEASQFGTEPQRIGVMGTSSGGHLAMLSAMRPRDERYAAIPLPSGSADVNAQVRFVVLCYPVADPLFRYHYAQQVSKQEGPWAKRYAGHVLPNHHKFWADEAAMAEGSPVLLLERGERVELPPAFCVVASGDRSHPRESIDRLVEAYRARGALMEFVEVEHSEADFFNLEPASRASMDAIRHITAFIHRHAA